MDNQRAQDKSKHFGNRSRQSIPHANTKPQPIFRSFWCVDPKSNGQAGFLSMPERRLAEMLPCEDKMKSRATAPGLLQENQIILGYH
jgi:hypothetical protein